jgi:hypothetical protein
MRLTEHDLQPWEYPATENVAVPGVVNIGQQNRSTDPLPIVLGGKVCLMYDHMFCYIEKRFRFLEIRLCFLP